MGIKRHRIQEKLVEDELKHVRKNKHYKPNIRTEKDIERLKLFAKKVGLREHKKLGYMRPRTLRTYFYTFVRYYDKVFQYDNKKIGEHLALADKYIRNNKSNLLRKVCVNYFRFVRGVDDTIIEKKLYKGFSEKQRVTEDDILTRDELELLEKTEEEGDELYIRLLYDTAARNSELMNTRMRDIAESKQDNVYYVFAIQDGKGGKFRKTYVTRKRTAQLLNEHLERGGFGSDDKVFTIRMKNGKPYKNQEMALLNLVKRVHKRAVDAGVESSISLAQKSVFPHLFRHTRITHLIASGIRESIVQRMVGHESLSTTQIYTHLSSDMVEEGLSRALGVNK